MKQLCKQVATLQINLTVPINFNLRELTQHVSMLCALTWIVIIVDIKLLVSSFRVSYMSWLVCTCLFNEFIVLWWRRHDFLYRTRWKKDVHPSNDTLNLNTRKYEPDGTRLGFKSKLIKIIYRVWCCWESSWSWPLLRFLLRRKHQSWPMASQPARREPLPPSARRRFTPPSQLPAHAHTAV